MPSVEKAVVECERVADDDRHYYSQPDRMTEFGRDCSSMIGRALVLAGFDYPSGWSPSTREMKAYLERIGWVWHEGTAGVHRGCILWKTGHTAMAISGTMLAEALMSETHGIDGAPGDQTGWEIRRAPISYTSWEGYWSYPEEDDLTDEQAKQLRFIYDHMNWNDKTHFSDLGNLVAQMPITYGSGDSKTTASIGDRLAYIDAHTHRVDSKLDDLAAKIDALGVLLSNE